MRDVKRLLCCGLVLVGLSGCNRGRETPATSPLIDDGPGGEDDEENPDPADEGTARGSCVLPTSDRSFDEMKGPASALDGACVPEISRAALREAFFRLRDTRLGRDEAPDTEAMLVDTEGRARRLPWLLADNACELRAPAAAYLMHAWGFPTPYYARAKAKTRKKLHLSTPNFPTTVMWSSHVAPVLRSEGQLYVLDPAVEATGPITVDEWLVRITYGGTPADLDAAFCRDVPDNEKCFTATPRATYFPRDELGRALIPEWRLQQILGRLPEESLGDCPPGPVAATSLPRRPETLLPFSRRCSPRMRAPTISTRPSCSSATTSEKDSPP